MSWRLCRALSFAAAVACSSASSGTGVRGPARKATEASESTIEAGVASLGGGGEALIDLLSDDAWFLHHGVTDMMRDRDAVARYLTELASAYPRLRVETSTPVALGDEGWMVEATLVDESRNASGRLLALVQTRRRTAVSVELFGDDPRTLSTSTSTDPPISVPTPMELVPTSTIDPKHAAAMIEDHADTSTTLSSSEPRIRLAARGSSTIVAVLVVDGEDSDGVPVSLHAAVIAEQRGDDTIARRVYVNPRQTAVFDMGNLTRGHEDLLRSELHSKELHWGAWQGYCCEHGVRTRACRLIGIPQVEQCRALNRLAFVCRQAYHCTGAECFCCASGLDAACEMQDVPNTEPGVPPSRRPAAPTIWSPY